MVCDSKIIIQIEKKTLDTHLHLIETIIKLIALYTCENWGDCDKKSKIKLEQFHVLLCKQVLGVRKRTCNIKVLAQLGRLPFQIYIETQMFKDCVRYIFASLFCMSKGEKL